MDIKHGFAGSVGDTPLLRLDALSAETGCEILGKAEFMNPGGSQRDAAQSMQRVSTNQSPGASNACRSPFM